MAGSSAWQRVAQYLGLAQGETRRQAFPHVLRRRIDHLEGRIEALARLADIDPRRLPPPEPVCSPQVVALVREGKEIQAIKLHREQTGLGLASPCTSSARPRTRRRCSGGTAEAKWDIDALR